MSVFVRPFFARALPLARAASLVCGATLSLSVVACGTDPADPTGSTGNNSKGATSEDDDDDDDDTSSETPVKPTKVDAGKAKPMVTADAGASGGSGDKTPPTSSTGSDKSLWCDALAVFADKCQSCHGATLAAGAPMSLVTYADATAAAKVTKGKKVSEVVATRVHDVKNPMPPGMPLDAASLAAIDAWIADGAKPGDDATCAGQIEEKPTAATQPWPPEGCDATYKILAGNGQDVSVPAGQEIHPQFTMDAPWGNDKVQALAFRPVTDNKAVLHHWILNGGGAFINGWAPGQDDSKKGPPLPDVGVFLPAGKGSLRLDMHYNNLQGTKAELDQSGLEVCVTHQLRKYTATTFSGFSALPNIPAGKEVDIVGTCNVAVTQPVFLISESPHAHKLATHMKLVVKRAGVETVLHDGPFAFDGQVATPLAEPFELKAGDQVVTTCHYKNDTNKTVGFGENTGNEMCFNFATYYPMGALSCSGGGGLAGGGSNPFGGSLFGGN
jgi:hypothetical protein